MAGANVVSAGQLQTGGSFMSIGAPVDTRQRLIDVAGEVFAEVGYSDATVRDIC